MTLKISGGSLGRNPYRLSFNLMYFYIYSHVLSEPHSRVPGDRNWRHRVVDIMVFVSGSLHVLPTLKEMFEGRSSTLQGLTVSCYSRFY